MNNKVAAFDNNGTHTNQYNSDIELIKAANKSLTTPKQRPAKVAAAPD